jgi:hypothetical protein
LASFSEQVVVDVEGIGEVLFCHATPRSDEEIMTTSVISYFAEEGATWWLEWFPAAGFDEMRRAVVRGPLRAS